jgi:hypothetical protein
MDKLENQSITTDTSTVTPPKKIEFSKSSLFLSPF